MPIAVWQLAGARRQAAAESMNHDHGHDQEHSHGHAAVTFTWTVQHREECGHDHAHGAAAITTTHIPTPTQTRHAAVEDDHGHEHGWAPWRYMVTRDSRCSCTSSACRRQGLTPYRATRSTSRHLDQSERDGRCPLLAGGPAMTKVLRKREPRSCGWPSRSYRGGCHAGRHDIYDGDIGIIRGEFVPITTGGEREFTLVRWNMTCCVADAITLETRIIAPDPVRASRPTLGSSRGRDLVRTQTDKASGSRS